MPAAINYLCFAPAGGNTAAGSAARVSDDPVSDFEKRLRECHRLVYQVALGVLRDPADADEIAQDAFLRAYQKFSSRRDPGKFRAWVARTSFRLALNRRRAAERIRRRDTSSSETIPASGGNVENIAAQREFDVRLRREIDRLPEKLRAVLLLSAVEELNAADIAGMLGIPEGTVRSRLYLARKELFKVLCNEALS